MRIRPGRHAAGVIAVGATLVAVSCAPATTLTGEDDVRRTANAPQKLHLPTAVNAPGTWSSEEGVRGPVAALGLATRTRTDGVFDDKQSLAVFAVSAVDGSASWIHLPGFSLESVGLRGRVRRLARRTVDRLGQAAAEAPVPGGCEWPAGQS